MADQSDVENAITQLAAAALYPGGPGTPSVPGPDCRIYRGWPTPAALDSDLAAGKINVTVFPVEEPGRNVTRYLNNGAAVAAAPTLKASVSGNTATLSGAAAAGQTAALIVDALSYVYEVQAGDTPETVAANLATLARATAVVNLSAATFTIPSASRLLVRIVASAVYGEETRRQEQGFRLSCWCPTPDLRDATAAALDASFAGLNFISLPDGSLGRIRYRGTMTFDQSQDALLYRRDLLYDVEFATITRTMQPAMAVGELILNADSITA